MIKRWFRFIILLLVLVIILVPLNFYIYEVVMSVTFGPTNYIIYGYFIVLVSMAQFILARSLKERPQKFVINFMAIMGIKMFLSLGVLVIVAYSGINNNKYFIINYLLLYLIFSSFSIQQILTFQNKVLHPSDKKENS